jgi:alpha-glucosidase (family GH31 glycosyl hydrolase)
MDTWLPPGTWIEQGTHAVLRGDATSGTVLSKSYHLQEIPIFVRGGAITTDRPVTSYTGFIGIASRQYTALVFAVWPGAASGSANVYEDDGATVAYVGGAYAWTRASYTRSTNQLTFRVTTEGSYPSLPTQRRYVLRIVNSLAPSSVTVNGVTIPWTVSPTDKTWYIHLFSLV